MSLQRSCTRNIDTVLLTIGTLEPHGVINNGADNTAPVVLSGRPVHSAALHVKLDSGAVLDLAHLAAAEPGIAGHWLLLGQGWQAQWTGGYLPELGGWRIGPVRLFHEGRWCEVGSRAEPRTGMREPWAQAHVAGAGAFVRLVETGDRGALATFTEGARVQHVLAAAMRAETEGRRVPLAEGSGQLPGGTPEGGCASAAATG